MKSHRNFPSREIYNPFPSFSPECLFSISSPNQSNAKSVILCRMRSGKSNNRGGSFVPDNSLQFRIFEPMRNTKGGLCACNLRRVKMALAAQNPSVEQQRVIIPNKRGEKLVGTLHESGTSDIVILCHGFRCSKDTGLILNLAVALENAKISSFRFDFSGNGESEGSFQYGNYWTEVDDLHAVVQHFHESNRVIRALVGHSKGGDVVLLHASKYHDIKTVINLSGRYDLKAGIEERLGKDYLERIRKDGFIDVKKRSGSFDYRVTEESLMDRLGTNMHEACLQIDKECRVFTIHGSSDEIIAVQDAHEFAKIIPNHKLHIIEGANHAFNNHQNELSSVVSFITETVHHNKGTAS